MYFEAFVFLGRAKKIFSFASEVFEKRGAGGRIFFLFSRFFLLNSLVKFHEEEFDGDMLFVLNITG